MGENMAAIVAGALLFLFGFIAIAIALTAGHPPLLADPVPASAPSLVTTSSTAPTNVSTGSGLLGAGATSATVGSGTSTSTATTPTGTTTTTAATTRSANDGTLPPQYRGAVDGNARLLALLAVVSPLLTTIVGFYYGQRTGAVVEKAANQQVKVTQQALTRKAQDVTDKEGAKAAQSLLDELRSSGVT